MLHKCGYSSRASYRACEYSSHCDISLKQDLFDSCCDKCTMRTGVRPAAAPAVLWCWRATCTCFYQQYSLSADGDGCFWADNGGLIISDEHSPFCCCFFFHYKPQGGQGFSCAAAATAAAAWGLVSQWGDAGSLTCCRIRSGHARRQTPIIFVPMCCCNIRRKHHRHQPGFKGNRTGL